MRDLDYFEKLVQDDKNDTDRRGGWGENFTAQGLLRALQAISALHVKAYKPVEKWAAGYHWSNEHCAHDGEQWPCETIQAMEKGLN